MLFDEYFGGSTPSIKDKGTVLWEDVPRETNNSIVTPVEVESNVKGVCSFFSKLSKKVGLCLKL